MRIFSHQRISLCGVCMWYNFSFVVLIFSYCGRTPKTSQSKFSDFSQWFSLGTGNCTEEFCWRLFLMCLRTEDDQKGEWKQKFQITMSQRNLKWIFVLWFLEVLSDLCFRIGVVYSPSNKLKSLPSWSDSLR